MAAPAAGAATHFSGIEPTAGSVKGALAAPCQYRRRKEGFSDKTIQAALNINHDELVRHATAEYARHRCRLRASCAGITSGSWSAFKAPKRHKRTCTTSGHHFKGKHLPWLNQGNVRSPDSYTDAHREQARTASAKVAARAAERYARLLGLADQGYDARQIASSEGTTLAATRTGLATARKRRDAERMASRPPLWNET